MGKRKNKGTAEYLPLRWVKELQKQFVEVFGAKADPVDMQVFCSVTADNDAKVQMVHKYPILSELIAFSETKDERMQEVFKQSGFNSMELMRDLDGISLAALWGRNKQVFKFDKDFLEELLHTKTVSYTKDLWDYLPYDVFYVDISDYPELCEKVAMQGFIVKREKGSEGGKDYWYLHILRFTEDFFFTDFQRYANETIDRVVEEEELQTIDTYANLAGNKKGLTVQKGSISLSPSLYEVVITQILTYLCVDKPDLVENERSRECYRKPNPSVPPKHKFSELRTWDVGVTFGTSVRKWKEQQRERVVGVSGGVGSKKRPHRRRAHWGHRWTGHGTDKVLRPVWIAETTVNCSADTDTNPVVIHKQ